MAEIHVQAKKHNNSSPVWIWIVAAVLIIGAIIYYLMTRNNNQHNSQNQTNTTSGVQLPQQVTDVTHIMSKAA
jgi:flagellar basal body-associated protein FliL